MEQIRRLAAVRSTARASNDNETRTMIVRVNLAQRSYDISITSHDSAGLGRFARQNTAGLVAFVVTDEHVTGHARAVADSLTAAGF